MLRRDFLKAATGVILAPAVVKAESLMKIWTPPQHLVLEVGQMSLYKDTATLTFWAKKGGGPWNLYSTILNPTDVVDGKIKINVQNIDYFTRMQLETSTR